VDAMPFERCAPMPKLALLAMLFLVLSGCASGSLDCATIQTQPASAPMRTAMNASASGQPQA
jgi:hypothetical protein